jgi:hypothetical protein
LERQSRVRGASLTILRPARSSLLRLGALALLAGAADGAVAQVAPARVEQAPEVDGVLDEEVWQRATPVEDFIQRAPVEGDPPSQRTVVSVLYTSRALYLGVRAEDARPEAIVATVLKRDDFTITENDQFAVAIDSYDDGRNGFWFSTNPLGVRVDAQFFEEGAIFESDWDAVWRCASRIDTGGWTAEIEIPFSTLRFENRDVVVMGLNFFRRLIRTNEALFAPRIPLDYAYGTTNVSIARKYVFEGITGGGREVSLKPYALAGYQHGDAASEPEPEKEVREAGLDLRYGLTDNLRLTLSYNTDFAEAEVDDRQINLTRFSLFFPEKRDFFLEDAGAFEFGAPGEAQVFFSRRIGLAEDSSGVTLRVPILLGGKLTGRTGPVGVGLLDARTESSAAVGGANYSVGRVRAGFGDRSYVGAIFTGSAPNDGPDQQALGADYTLYLTPTIGVRGFASTILGDGRDASRGESSAAQVSLFREGERTAFDAGFMVVGEAFDPATGFVLRNGIRKWNGSVSVPKYWEQGFLRRLTPGLQGVYYQEIDGGLQSAEGGASLALDLLSDDRAVVALRRVAENPTDTFPIFHSVLIPAGDYAWTEGELQVTTKPGRPWSADIRAVVGGYYGGSRADLGGSLRWRAGRHVTLSQFYETSAVDLERDSFRTHLLRSRVDYSLNTHLSLAGLLQYDNDTDQVGLHLRFDFLLREGTELFFVWDEVMDDRGDGGPGRSRSRVALLKLTYLLGI